MKAALVTLFYLLLFNYLIYRFPAFRFRHYRPLITHLLFNLKFVAGIFIWVVYTFYYQETVNNDVHKFYNDALVLRYVAEENPHAFFTLMFTGKEVNDVHACEMKNWHRHFDEAPFNENRTIIRLNALLMFITVKTYFAHVLIFCFLALAGLVMLTNAILALAPQRNAIVALPVLFLPSLLFWGSGVMKEPLLILGLGLCVSGLLSSFSARSALKLLAGLVVILLTKFFVLACLLPAACAYLLFRQRGSASVKWIAVKYAVVCLVFAAIAFSIHYIVPSVDPAQMLVNKQTHAIKEAAYWRAGSIVSIPEIKPDVLSITRAALAGMWNSIARPYVWEIKNLLMAASAIENVFVITWLLMCISAIKWKQLPNANVFFFLLLFALSYFALVGMATPVLGNLVRYKTPLLPVFIFAFIIAMRPKAVAENFSFVLRKD